MALPKMSEVQDLSDDELQAQIVETKKLLFELRLQKATRRLEQPHQFKHARHRLAQLLTLERQRELDALSQEDSDVDQANQPPAEVADGNDSEAAGSASDVDGSDEVEE